MRAVEAWVQAVRTGEHVAARRAGDFLSESVVLVAGDGEHVGRQAVTERITGQWLFTPTLVHALWPEPEEVDGSLVVDAVVPPMGAAPTTYKLTFQFDEAGAIRRVEEDLRLPGPPEPTDRIPDHVRTTVNRALANGTPMIVAYVDPERGPQQAPRGSTQVYSDTQLCIWVRAPRGGIVDALESEPRLSLLYRDSRSRTTLIFQGRGHVSEDEAVRQRVFDLSPEIEQRHDPDRKGAALIIDITKLQGTSPFGPVLLQRDI